MILDTPLPRLLYVGDVAVEQTYHGSLVLYRLLQDYPKDRLLIVEAEPYSSLPERRLTGVEYRKLPMWPTRLRQTRFARLEGSWQTLTCARSSKFLSRSVQDFKPDAVLTVAQGYSWLTAARFAEEANVPLHLLLHDHCSDTSLAYEWLKPWRDRQLGKVYRQAASRLCVTPTMEEEYRRDYGVPGQVLYVTREKDRPADDQPPRTYGKSSKSLVGAYAGNLFGSGYVQLLRNLADCLEARGDQLMLYGPWSTETRRDWGLDRPNILFQGLAKSEELRRQLRERADFLFVPIPFDPSIRSLRLVIPTKLTDYTATGLPLLICGPSYGALVRWAEQYAPVAEVVTSSDLDQLKAAIGRLEDPQHRITLGQAASRVGNLLFSYDKCIQTFWTALRNPSRANELRLNDATVAVRFHQGQTL